MSLKSGSDLHHSNTTEVLGLIFEIFKTLKIFFCGYFPDENSWFSQLEILWIWIPNGFSITSKLKKILTHYGSSEKSCLWKVVVIYTTVILLKYWDSFLRFFIATCRRIWWKGKGFQIRAIPQKFSEWSKELSSAWKTLCGSSHRVWRARFLKI